MLHDHPAFHQPKEGGSKVAPILHPDQIPKSSKNSSSPISGYGDGVDMLIIFAG
jgi:hypothetical protein